MGWFWTERPSAASLSATTTAPHPIPQGSSESPPPGCPMHASDNSKTSATSSSSSTMAGLFSSAGASSSSSSSSPPSGAGCPVKHDSSTSSPPPPPPPSGASGCPVNHADQVSSFPQSSKPSSSSSSPEGLLGKLNPLNYMPTLSQAPAAEQKYALPTSREASSIPRGDVDGNWEYPSPQQMYNAMLRKSGGDASGTPIDAVESMVAVHNFLNEGAWEEIEAWEARFSRGLAFGWRTCRSGERGFEREYLAAKREPGWRDAPRPRLERFMGRPGESTPKVKILQALGYVAPRWAGDKPFDRHDWYVQRRGPGGEERQVRYVIDYYSGEPEPTGEPVFYLDVRPAIDGPTAAAERLMRWGGDVWYRASGGEARR